MPVGVVDAADFYSGIVVDAYAKLKSTSFVAQVYANFVRSAGLPGLEIGCGDGEPLLDLCAEGLDIDGVDSSLDMVTRCRENAAYRGLNVAVYHQRVEHLALERRYRSIYFAGPTFNLLPDDETALRALHAIREHLSGDGMALIPLWIPEPTPTEDLGVRRETEDDGAVLRYTPRWESYDRDQRTRTTATRYEWADSTRVESVDQAWIIHWHTPDRFRRMCADVGLTIVSLVDDHTSHEANDASTAFTATLRRG
jgi:hypothetical protein